MPLALALVVALLLAGCGEPTESEEPVVTAAPPTVPATPSGDRVELVVFAAASLREVLAATKAVYEADHPNVTVTVAADSSAALRTQIEQGAGADVFLAADDTHPQRLVDAGLAAGEVEVFATNALALVVPASNPAELDDASDLARPGVQIVAAGEDVPISTYAAEVVDRLAALPGYPGAFATDYRGNVVSREDNVRAVLTKIELGEGDAALVYVTDAVASTQVRVIPLPEGANVQAGYAGVVVGSSRQPAEARRFFEWLVGPDGQAILAGFGFGPPP